MNIFEFSEDGLSIIGVTDRNVRHISIPNGITRIGGTRIVLDDDSTKTTYVDIVGAFQGCSDLESVDVSDSVIVIGKNAFALCSSLNNINIPHSIWRIGEGAFKYCVSLQNINISYGVSEIGDAAFYCCKSLRSIDIPSSVRKIGARVFSGCTSLQDIIIPSSVVEIGRDAFRWCTSLHDVRVHEDNRAYKSVHGILFDFDCNEIIYMPLGKQLPEYEIPSGVRKIGPHAFWLCSFLQCVTIPESVREIGEWAFMDCSTLRSIHCRITNIECIDGLDEVFDDNLFENCVLYVPSCKWSEYVSHPVFGKFKHIGIDGVVDEHF
ncbi:MAG: leucine-rich repeat domain-containing protein [Bacteroidaceae bacterium]|nr:leucine-rich repeat domain-containing protein [Bacteroidaceae bacterium]